MKKYVIALAYEKTICDDELKYVHSDSLEELCQVVRTFIDENDVLSSEWQGGQVYDVEKKELVGIVAYNGKFFNKEEAKKYGLK